jgi:phage tail-like protein
MAETEADKQVFANGFRCDLSEDILRITSITMDLKKMDATMGIHAYKEYRPSQPTYGTLSFTMAEHKDGSKKLYQWVKDAQDGKDVRKDLTVEILAQNGDTVRTFNLYRVFPIACRTLDLNSQGGSRSLQITIDCRVQRVEMK